MGNFNEVRNEMERLGLTFNQAFVRVFNDFIDSLDLVDIHFDVPYFTWSEKWGSKCSKFDRFLVINGFLGSFPNLTGLVLEKTIPDHHPILLLEHWDDYDPTPFHLLHSWLDMDGLFVVV